MKYNNKEMAWQSFSDGNIRDAVSFSCEHLETEPQDTEILILLSACFFELDKCKTSGEYLLRARQIDPDSIRCFVLMNAKVLLESPCMKISDFLESLKAE